MHLPAGRPRSDDKPYFRVFLLFLYQLLHLFNLFFLDINDILGQFLYFFLL